MPERKRPESKICGFLLAMITPKVVVKAFVISYWFTCEVPSGFKNF